MCVCKIRYILCIIYADTIMKDNVNMKGDTRHICLKKAKIVC